MKADLRMLIAFAAIICCTATAAAQGSGKQRMTREQFAEAQARHLADGLELDDAASERLVATYCAFQEELWAIGRCPRPRKGQPLDEEASEEAIKARFEHSRKVLDLREKYYGLYSEFLTQGQIARLYELERQMMRRLGARHAKPDRPTGQGRAVQ